MTNTTIWQQNSSDPHNADNLAAIAQWWHNLQGKEIIWQQRLIPESNQLSKINWETQRFDENFVITNAQLKGITVYWQKNPSAEVRNITAQKLELDNFNQKLYIYPQTQSQVVICVTSPQIIYRTIELAHPEIAGKVKGEDYLLLLRDGEKKLEVKVTLNKQQLKQILEKI
jgi:hypothetical protein